MKETAILVMSPEMVALYLAHMEQEGKAHKTIRSHLSAISFKFRLHNITDPMKFALVDKTIQGIKNRYLSSNNSQPRKPIDKPLLSRLVNVIPSCAANPYERAMFHAVFLLAHFACLRAGEISLSNNKEHMLQSEQFTREVSQGGASYTVHFATYKHSNHQTPQIKLCSSPDPNLCPVSALDTYLSLRGTFKGPLMQSPSGKPLTRYRLAQFLRSCLTLCNEQPDLYGTHSFRIGRATQLAEEHAADVTIRSAGRWNSNAFKSYIRPSTFTAPS